MFYAKNEAGETVYIEDAKEGQKYFCPSYGCELIVRAKNSTKKKVHFAHKCKRDCPDTWHYEEMSEWHRDWQSRFPVETREVRVTKDGVNHRADVLINGVVIEFQHSPISAEEFSERNRFYKSCGYKVAWVFDAKDRARFDKDSYLCYWNKKFGTFDGATEWPTHQLFFDNAIPEHPDMLVMTQVVDCKCFSPCFTIEKQPYSYLSVFDYKSFLKEFQASNDNSVSSITEIIHNLINNYNYEQLRNRLVYYSSYSPRITVSPQTNYGRKKNYGYSKKYGQRRGKRR